MKKLLILSCLALGLFGACKEIDIETYKLENAAVCFSVTSSSFSLKGITDEWTTVTVPVTLIGPLTDYDREFSVRVLVENSMDAAQEGVDFKVLDHKVDANETSGYVTLQLKKFSDGVSKLRTTLQIEANDKFKLGYPDYCKVKVEWSEEYVRPELGVWRYWFTYFCKGYSRDFQKIVVEVLGEEAEHYTGSASYVKTNPDLTMKMPTWWYEASRAIYQAVKEHDAANPGHPFMHSDDYEMYSSYNTAVGEGTKPEVTPTILETLITL